MLVYHTMAFLAGFVLDLLVGDPYWLPHPIRWIGGWIGWLDKKLLGSGTGGSDGRIEEKKGRWLAALVLIPVTVLSCCILYTGYALHPIAGFVIESVMTYQLLALKCLRVESMKVYYRLREDDLAGARKAVSMIVGRDTKVLTHAGVAKAAVETVAENATDGVIAPMLYLALGGPVLGFFYKAVNTMDSMVGYKNERYLFFGRAAARLDDVLNYIPARISALLMVLGAYLPGGDYSGRAAWSIFVRDRYNHASPNSAQTEAACAGALGIQLAGAASYFGKTVEKPVIGDAKRAVETEDIRRANALLYRTAFLGIAVCITALCMCIAAR